jgi:O-antigen/teichoic acid export membrane protein
LVPVIGIVGAGAAALVAAAVGLGSTWLISRRLYPIPYQWRLVGLALISVGLGFFAGRALAPGDPLSVLVRTALILVVVVIFDRLQILPISTILRRSIGRLRERE